MKQLIAFALLAACELQPAPPAPPPTAPPSGSGAAQPVLAGSGSAAAAAPAAAPAPTAVAPPAPAAPPPVDVSPQCEQAGIKLATLMIDGAEPSQKPAFERDRANIVRRTEIVCSQQHWVPAALSCINQSKNDGDARACLEKFPPPAPAAPPAHATGSAAPSPTRRGPSGPAGSVPVTEQQTRGTGRIPEPRGSAAKR
jgi:hypothetical protein